MLFIICDGFQDMLKLQMLQMLLLVMYIINPYYT